MSYAGLPRPVYRTAFPSFGVLESQVMDSSSNGSGWIQVAANTQITSGTGITLFIAASDNLAALTNPTWTQVGALSNGAWSQSISGVTGRYARYRVILWRNATTEASPALQDITFTYATLPAAFNKTTPANGATGQPINVTLQWAPSSGADHYRYCFATTSGCLPTTNNGTATSVALSGLPPNTTYFWQVRACSDPNCVVFTDASGGHWSFTTVSAPGSFNKTTPTNGATGLPTNVTLQWQPASGTVVRYEYCVATVSGCTPNQDAGTSTSVNVVLQPGTTYYWQVRACADAGCTVSTLANGGQHWSFTTAQPIGSFNKSAPGNSAININPATTSLQWSSASSATEYRLCLGTAVNACNIIGGSPGQYQSVGSNTSQALGALGLQPDTTYYWQVLATNGTYTTFANGNALAFWSFTTLPNGPGAFGKSNPAFNATNVPTQNVSFTWQPSTGAVSYTVCVGAFSGDCSLSATSTTTSVVLPGPLPAGATLVWQVTAHNAGGTTSANNGQWWPFTTLPNAPQPFSKFSPPDNATDQPLGIVLSWQNVPNEDYYQVCAGTALGLCNLANLTTSANTVGYALTGLDYGTQYYWQVSACNAGGCTPANNGVAWSFKTKNPPLPGPFQKTNPPNGAINVPTNTTTVLLQWTAASDADGYEVCFGTQPNTCDLSGGGFQNVGAVTQQTVAGLPFSVTLQPATTYYWQVRAYNNLTATRTFANGGLDFSFTTLNPPGPGEFSKDAPVNGTFNLPTVSVTLRWFPSAAATSYEVCVGTAQGSCNALPGNTWQDVGSALTTTVSGLQPGTDYWWQVRALSAGGARAANGGTWWRFTTRNENPPAEFSKAAPLHLATGQPTATLVLSWFVSTGATGYRVCVGSAPGLCDATGGWVNVGNVIQWTVTPALQSATTYWWQVVALGTGFSVQANGGQWWAFTTANDSAPAPGAFGKLTPPQGASGQLTNGLELRWQSASSASGYQVCLGTQAGLCDVTGSWVNVGNSTSWNALQLQPSTTYWWQVRAFNANGQTQADSGAWWYFTTQAPPNAPGAFNKVLPANNAANEPTTLSLNWTSPVNVSGYHVCVGTTPGDCSVTGGWASAAGTSYALSGLAHDTTYWWQVRAFNANGQTLANNGVWWRFTTGNSPNPVPGPFGKVAPAHQSIGIATNALLSWSASSGAQRYTVCVGTQPGLCDVMNQVEVLSPTVSLALANAQSGRTYWWQVTARLPGQLRQADDGNWWAFTTANSQSPSSFQKSAPVSGTVVGTSAVLSWTASSGAVAYRVCVGTVWGLCDVVNEATTTDLGYAVSGLASGSYWWQVTAVDANGNTAQADGGVRWQLVAQGYSIVDLDNADTRKEAAPTAVRMGELVTYTIVLSNNGTVAATARVTDTLAVSATLVSATSGYTQIGQTLVWSNVVVPAGGTATLTVTVRAASGPLPGGYMLANSVSIGTHDGEFVRAAPSVAVAPHRAFVPTARKP
ncbi:MAG: hypothetical protein RMM31_06585 [Anaerolineae bacterium]|nr:hypothetical protein [Anaerolineae bacterium]